MITSPKKRRLIVDIERHEEERQKEEIKVLTQISTNSKAISKSSELIGRSSASQAKTDECVSIKISSSGVLERGSWQKMRSKTNDHA